MNGATRIWALAGGAATVAALAGGWFLGVQPQLAAAATSDAATSAAVTQNQATANHITVLSKAAAKTDSLVAQNAVLLKSVPTVLKPNTFIRRINEVAALDGVTVASVALGDSTAYTAPLAGETTTLAFGATDPAITATDFTAVPATVAVTGTADAILQFSHDIQNDERVFLIDNVQTARNESVSGSLTGTFAGFIYTLKR